MSRFQLISTTGRSLAVRTIGRLQCVQGCGSSLSGRSAPLYADPGTSKCQSGDEYIQGPHLMGIPMIVSCKYSASLLHLRHNTLMFTARCTIFPSLTTNEMRIGSFARNFHIGFDPDYESRYKYATRL